MQVFIQKDYRYFQNGYKIEDRGFERGSRAKGHATPLYYNL